MLWPVMRRNGAGKGAFSTIEKIRGGVRGL